VINSRQVATRRWWNTAADRYLLHASNLVLTECGAGDLDVASERLAILQDVDLLDIDEETGALASLLLANHAVPNTEPRDATHIAVAAVNGIDFLATWNFKHINESIDPTPD
jgi:predicted nucleic acid-binding protein